MSVERLWRRLDDAWHGAVPPLHLRGAAAGAVTLDAVGDVLRALGREPRRATATLRAYRDGGGDHALEDRVVHDPPRPAEPLERWARRLFRRGRWCVVLNFAEWWDEALCRGVARLLEPALAGARARRWSVELTLFMGDYGFTPFGAHWDNATTTVVQLHLGPAPKVMTTWSRNAFRRLTGSERSQFAPRQLVQRGRSHRLEAGDLFVLPADCFHVGFTHGPCASVSVALTPLERRADRARAMAWAAERLDDERARPAALETSVAHWAKASARRWRARQSSLLGFTGAPPPRPEPRALRGRTVRLAAPFRIQSLREGGRLYLYVRGAEVSLSANGAAVLPLVRTLNRGDAVRVNELVERFGGALEERAILHLLGELHRHRGLDLVE